MYKVLILVFSLGSLSSFGMQGSYFSCEAGLEVKSLEGEVLNKHVYKTVLLEKSENSDKKKIASVDFTESISLDFYILDNGDGEPSFKVTIDGDDNSASFSNDLSSENLEYIYLDAESIYIDKKLVSFDVECED